MYYGFPYCERDLLSIVHRTLLFDHHISTLFVHVQVGIQGKSQVFEVVNFADLFVMWVRESGLGYPGSLPPACFVGGSFVENNNLAFSCPIMYFCSMILSPVWGGATVIILMSSSALSAQRHRLSTSARAPIHFAPVHCAVGKFSLNSRSRLPRKMA